MSQVRFADQYAIAKQAGDIAGRQKVEQVLEFLEAANKQGVSFVLNIAQGPNARSVTAAYRRAGKNMIDIAVSHCHPDDEFVAVEGMAVAVMNLDSGRYIQRFVPDGQSADEAVIRMFQ